MAIKSIRRQDDESHADFWALYVRFGNHKGPPQNAQGERYGRWTIVGLESWGAGGSMWLARCDCGRERHMRLGNMKKGISQSCGCRWAEVKFKHGMSRTRPYKIWFHMRRRCSIPTDDAYPNYGGRGIKVCDRWQDFSAFWADMEKGYSDLLTLERKNVNGNYEPDNCCWISKSDQMQNLQRTIRIPTPKGEMTLTQACKAFSVNRNTLRGRIRYGWPPERLLEGYC